MKKQLLFYLAMTLSLAEFVRAQDLVMLTGFPPLRNAVSRQYLPEQSIYYCEDLESHYFVLYDIGSPNSVIVSEFPSYLELKDFEVYEDTVFFCGVFPQSTTPWGFVGQISVQDLFYNNGPYNIGTYFQLNKAPCPPTAYIATCDRMDVFRDSGYVHLAIVGELEHSLYYGTSLRRSAFDIWFDGTYWQGKALYQKEEYYKPCDITCTENYVVVSAYDDDLDYSVLLVFKKITGYPAFPIANNSFRLHDRRFDNNILVERLLEDDIAVSHYFFDTADKIYGTAVHYINDVSMLPSPPTHFSLHYKHGPDAPMSVLRDMRYKWDDLLLLHDIKDPLWNSLISTIFDFNAYNLSSMIAQAWYANEDVSLFSVDNRVQNPFFTLGGNINSYSEPLLTLRASGSNVCYEPLLINYKDVNIRFSTGEFEETINPLLRQRMYTFTPNPQVYEIENKCGELKKHKSHE
ncbi:MAG: hypothetical protein J6X59_05945 [Bacteroidales bacterium]|nr:hypothetical protein [Bacteroidales bacterium]